MSTTRTVGSPADNTTPPPPTGTAHNTAIHITATPETRPAPPDAPPLGPAAPLSAAYCAERAAAAVHRAETADFGPHEAYLAVAEQWRLLAQAMATNTAMSRPRDHDDTRR